jgi:copper homeostasis protein
MAATRKSRDRVRVEVAVESPDGAAAAVEGGADRVELCAQLACGGVTPSHGAIIATLEQALVPLVLLVRPRAGDFLYSVREFDVMRRDIEAGLRAGVHGFALGVLLADGCIDLRRTALLVESCGGRSVTFHRAFDQVPDADAALDELIALGVARVLTSGRARTAIEGASQLARLVQRAAGRIVILPAGGVRPENIAALVAATGVREVHFSAGRRVRSPMDSAPAVPLASPDPVRDDELLQTDPAIVRACLDALR